jgi:hypothetical protein
VEHSVFEVGFGGIGAWIGGFVDVPRGTLDASVRFFVVMFCGGFWMICGWFLAVCGDLVSSDLYMPRHRQNLRSKFFS